jgi:hypothetical protein
VVVVGVVVVGVVGAGVADPLDDPPADELEETDVPCG